MNHLGMLWFLIKKNIVLRRRTLCYTFMEAMVPLSYTLSLFMMRYYTLKETQPQTSDPILKKGNPFNTTGYTVIGYAPRSPATNNFMDQVEHLIFQKPWFNASSNVQILGFNSEYSMMEFERKNPLFLTYGYTFDRVDMFSASLPSKLHIIGKTKINTTSDNLLTEKEAMVLQTLMEVFINDRTGKKHNINVEFEEFSFNIKPRNDKFLTEEMSHVGLIIVGLTSYLLWRSIYLIASERQRCILMLLEHTGVHQGVYWLSWFITTFIRNEIVCLYMAGLLQIGIFGMEPVLMLSETVPIFLYFTTVAFALSSYCIMGSVLFKNAKTCSAVATIGYVLAILSALDTSEIHVQDGFTSFFIVSVNIIDTLEYIGHLEHNGIGFSWRQIPNHIKSEHFTISLLISGLMYLCIAFVAYNVVLCHQLPKIDFQCFRTKRIDPEPENNERDGKMYSRIGIRVDELFASSYRKLLNVSLIMLEDSITVMTGRELSGKSIFMSALKGDITPSKGTITIYGLDRVTDTLSVKLITGLCPKEFSAIFPELTIYENLKFFGTMKHLCQGKTMTDIVTLAREFMLESVINTPVHLLGNSDRRLLQVAIAFLGQNKIILLDDPSLNMDIKTKYRMWSIIRDKAYNKTVVVNTNVAYEAEIIADRIVIFLNGRLKCCGSMQYINMFLGAGYHLVIEKRSQCNESFIEQLIYNLVLNSTLTGNSNRFMTFWLPMKATQSFQSLFSLLYTYRQKIGIINFTVNATTLNDAVVNLWEPGYIKKKSIKPVLVDNKLVASSSDISLCNTKKKAKFEAVLIDMQNIKQPVITTTTTTKRAILQKLTYNQPHQRITTSSFMMHAILRAVGRSKYTGFQQLLSQVRTLLKKKLVFSTCVIFIELLQVIALIIVALYPSSPIVDNYCGLNECRQLINFSSWYRTVVPISQGPVRTEMSEKLAERYRRLFNEKTVQVMEFDERSTSITQITKSLKESKLHAIIGASFQVKNESTHLCAKAFYLPYHLVVGSTVMLSLTAIMNTFLQHTTNSDNYTIQISTQNQMTEDILLSGVTGNLAKKHAQTASHLVTAINTISLLMIPYFLVTERQTGSKHMQLLSGVSPWLYWLTTYIFDFATYGFLCNTFSIANVADAANEKEDIILDMPILFAVNGLMMLPYIYVIQSFFTSPSTAVGFIMVFNYCITNPSWLLFNTDLDGLDVPDYIHYITMLTPPHILQQAVYQLELHKKSAVFCDGYKGYCPYPKHSQHREVCCPSICTKKGTCIEHDDFSFSTFNTKQIAYLIVMIMHMLFWGLMLVLIELKVFSKCASRFCPFILRRKQVINSFNIGCEVDFCVRPSTRFRLNQGPLHLLTKLADRTRISNNKFNNVSSGIIFENVKYTRKQSTISEINLKIEQGDLFCFAGVDIDEPCNVVNMIGGLTAPSYGKIIINGMQFDCFGRPPVNSMGYCSNKTTGVLNEMTGMETLRMFGNLRGVSRANINRLVEIYLTAFHLNLVAKREARTYSDCELRRLSIAAALIGEPEICLLCDPLYKLDSESKEDVWKWLTRLTQLKKTIVMASDNLREMGNHDAYISILVGGQPVSVGTVKSIESLYCTGYTLLVKLNEKDTISHVKRFITMLTTSLPKCQLFHSHTRLLHFHVPYEQESLANLFATVEDIAKCIQIESYRINKATLEQVLTAAQNAYFIHSAIPSSSEEHRVFGL